MKKSIFNSIVFLLLFNGLTALSQTTVTLQPNGITGKDAIVDSRVPNTNYGNHSDYTTWAWTNDGVLTKGRGFVHFDLSNIPSGATIIEAYMSLYSYYSPSNQSHSNQSRSNEAVLERVTSSWDESVITWNNQPTTTSQNSVYLPASTAPIQHYLNIDVTIMLQDMVNDPINSHGFMIKEITEQIYRKLVFASSDNTNSSLHPKLVITYLDSEIPPIDSDSCITLRPSFEGKDALIDSRVPNVNYGNHPDYLACTWTNGGALTTGRSLIDFELSSIPMGATINSAKLSLYSYNSLSNGSHSTQSGSNTAVLKRVLTSWNENTVTWNNQPSTTSQNEITIQSSTNSIQDYLDIDVTELVQDMIDNPNDSHGFLMQLMTEQIYRRLVFASSDNIDTNLHPKLEICYTEVKEPISINELNDNEYFISPNPAINVFSISSVENTPKEVYFDIRNTSGQVVLPKHKLNLQTPIDITNYSSGLYFVNLYINREIITKKLIIN